MITIHFEVKGVPPGILHHNPESMLIKKLGPSPPPPSPEEEAERGAYQKKGGELYIPERAVLACLREAAKKFTPRGLSKMIEGAIVVKPEEIGLGTKKYDIHITTVVIKGRGRIVRARAWLKEWSAKFDVTYNPIYAGGLLATKTIEILEYGGRRIGLLDFRPRYGKFEIVKAEVEET